MFADQNFESLVVDVDFADDAVIFQREDVVKNLQKLQNIWA